MRLLRSSLFINSVTFGIIAIGARAEAAALTGSRRAVALTSMAVEALRSHHVRQADVRSKAGLAWQDSGLVFTDALGEPLEGRYVLRHYVRPLLRRAGLPIIRFHDLRHTMAALLLAQGIPSKVVSEMLGHTTIGITLDLYSHVLPHRCSAKRRGRWSNSCVKSDTVFER